MRSVAQAEDQDLHDHGVRIQVQVRYLGEELDDESCGLVAGGRVAEPGRGASAG